MGITDDVEITAVNRLRIASWNCKGAYRKKHEYFKSKFDPDIWSIQECESPEKLLKNKKFDHPENHVWFGDNLNRGVSVFSKNGLVLKIPNYHEAKFRYVLPVEVSVKGRIITIFAVWAMNDANDRKQRYISQIYLALEYYASILRRPSIVLGDFNWNASFKENGKLYGGFNDVVESLDAVELNSIYHAQYSEAFGKESKPTLHFRGERDRKFHIDYIFSESRSIVAKSMKLGEWKDWYMLSDHMPLSFDMVI